LWSHGSLLQIYIFKVGCDKLPDHYLTMSKVDLRTIVVYLMCYLISLRQTINVIGFQLQ